MAQMKTLGFALVLTLLRVGVSFAQPQPLNQADLNDLEQSVDKLQNFFHKVHATNQRKFVSQEHLSGPRHPPATNPRLRATFQAVYIKDRNSGLVLQCQPNNDYQVILEHYNSTNIYQQWYVIESSFPKYYHIANSTVDDPFMKVIAAGDAIEDPLYRERMSSTLYQLFRSFVSQIPPRIIHTLSS